jgi:GT2 family glycosyltransferase/glycosyltransferase involved in cell wall biosynthesis
VKNTADTQTPICIAGAHRSGTSMLTRLLHACGLFLGPKNALMPPQADNPDGFWEHLGFVALNDELLDAQGGAWDLPPKTNETLSDERLDPLRMKARLLIEGFHSAQIWGWKDPRNSLTLPFWEDLLPGLKTLIIVRNPLEVAYSMRKRNGTSYAFGLRLWEIYSRRLIEAAGKHDRLLTHYDLFFENAEKELRRIANFIGLPDAKIHSAAELVATKRRHTHFTIDQLVDAGVSGEVVELYRALIAQALPTRRKTSVAKSAPGVKSHESDLLPGAVSRLHSFVPDRFAQIEHLYGELLAQTEARHKAEMEKLSAHLAHSEELHKAQVKELTTHLAKTEAAHKAQVKELATHLAKTEAAHKAQVKGLTTHLAKTEKQYKAQIEEISAHLAKTEKQYVAQIEEISAHLAKTEADYNNEIGQLRQRIVEMNGLLHQRSVNLAEDEKYIAQLTDRLRKQLQNTRRLSRLLDDTDDAARKLRTSRRWQLANPGATLKAKLAHRKAPAGYGHLEKIAAAYSKWRKEHPEIKKIDDEIKAVQVAKVPRSGQPGTDGQAPASAPREETVAAPDAPILQLTSICFSQHEEVDVSIIIPVFNQLEYTHACLASLQAVQEQPRFEVIVVDDGSTDGTPEVIQQIPEVVYLRNDSNSGFIASCNTGAKAARGKYLVFLNNDTLVKPGWLTALLDTFKEERRAGIVGSKLLYPDGRLQEAGGIIWQDASGWNYGKFDDPGKPEYNYLREVDYCSGAALMVSKTLFESAGGFDSRYAPGYYEDTDLAFKVRQAGYRVLYQPLSEVIHHEGATGGTDISTGAKKHQEINRSTFAEAWSDELAKRPANGDVRFLQRPRTLSGKNILVIDHHLPMPDRDSGSLRMFQILKILHRLGHRVTFLPDNLADMPPYTRELQKRGIQVVHHPYVKKVRDYLISHGPMFDVVVLSRCDFARKHIADVRLHAPQSCIIFDTVDLHHLREQREAQLTQDPDVRRKAQERQLLEDYLIKEADETWVVSPIEQQMLQENWPHKSIQLVSNIVDVTGPVTPFALRRDWLFIGGFQHRPNIDAVLFFVEEIYPLVRDRLPDTKFYIIGDKAPPEIVALASDRIIVAGLQRNVRPFFDSVRLSVAPLRFGAGIKGKINQSMAFGVPVVATSIAVEGMKLTDHEHVLVADKPQDFARALIELYESEELWKRLSQNGISKTQELYSTDAAREKLEFLFSDRHLKSLEPSGPVSEHELVVAADLDYGRE